MNVLVVGAHPEPQSFNVALRHRAIEVFRAAGHSVDVSDLYAEGFDPVAKAEDFGDRARQDYLVYALEQRHAQANGTLAADIARELQRVLAAELLVLVFPVYWFSVPAILKGWIDRVLVSGALYGGRRLYDRGPMRGRRALVITSLGGREHMFGPGSIHGRLEDLLKPLLVGTLGYVGYDVLPPFAAYHVPYVDDAARAEMLEALTAYLQDLDALKPLALPSLADFDAELRPLSK